jgi:hypothetical protein
MHSMETRPHLAHAGKGRWGLIYPFTPSGV